MFHFVIQFKRTVIHKKDDVQPQKDNNRQTLLFQSHCTLMECCEWHVCFATAVAVPLIDEPLDWDLSIKLPQDEISPMNWIFVFHAHGACNANCKLVQSCIYICTCTTHKLFMFNSINKLMEQVYTSVKFNLM